MRSVTLRFIENLRAAGLRVSISETMDAVRAVAAVGVERELLRESLAASLVKDEEDRPLFDKTFARFFAAPVSRQKNNRREQAQAGEGRQNGEDGHSPRTQDKPPEQRQPGERPVCQRTEQTSEQDAQSIELQEQRKDGQKQELFDKNPTPNTQPPAPHPKTHHKALLEKPFKTFDSRDVEANKELVEELARRLRSHLSRRYKRSKRGRLDFRRTIRASIAHGGVPINRQLRSRRPGKPDLVALCDLSGSVAVVSDFLLALLAPAADYFRRVQTFAYVDRLSTVSFEQGHVVPHEAIDLYAFSDFGKVLQHFWQEHGDSLLTRNTLVLVLGDARNNRRPPRPDLLARIHNHAKKLIWLNPEPRERWNTGDSVISRYAPGCDAVLECGNLHELLAALKQAL
jgi:uncharacterized protein with von Willebrand factor type A (vWA) domain